MRNFIDTNNYKQLSLSNYSLTGNFNERDDLTIGRWLVKLVRWYKDTNNYKSLDKSNEMNILHDFQKVCSLCGINVEIINEKRLNFYLLPNNPFQPNSSNGIECTTEFKYSSDLKKIIFFDINLRFQEEFDSGFKPRLYNDLNFTNNPKMETVKDFGVFKFGKYYNNIDVDDVNSIQNGFLNIFRMELKRAIYNNFFLDELKRWNLEHLYHDELESCLKELRELINIKVDERIFQDFSKQMLENDMVCDDIETQILSGIDIIQLNKTIFEIYKIIIRNNFVFIGQDYDRVGGEIEFRGKFSRMLQFRLHTVLGVNCLEPEVMFNSVIVETLMRTFGHLFEIPVTLQHNNFMNNNCYAGIGLNYLTLIENIDVKRLRIDNDFEDVIANRVSDRQIIEFSDVCIDLFKLCGVDLDDCFNFEKLASCSSLTEMCNKYPMFEVLYDVLGLDNVFMFSSVIKDKFNPMFETFMRKRFVFWCCYSSGGIDTNNFGMSKVTKSGNIHSNHFESWFGVNADEKLDFSDVNKQYFNFKYVLDMLLELQYGKKRLHHQNVTIINDFMVDIILKRKLISSDVRHQIVENISDGFELEKLCDLMLDKNISNFMDYISDELDYFENENEVNENKLRLISESFEKVFGHVGSNVNDNFVSLADVLRFGCLFGNFGLKMSSRGGNKMRYVSHESQTNLKKIKNIAENKTEIGILSIDRSRLDKNCDDLGYWLSVMYNKNKQFYLPNILQYS